ncbi:MAG: DEAD/DEAH box helicase [Caulobacteraceae bacterium]|nr:DEAD/DEAH box helicase [Caulobacter sp.]
MADPEAPVLDDLKPAGFASPDVADAAPALPLAGLALRLAQAAEAAGGDVLVLAQSEARAEELRRALRVFAPERETVVMPTWDCLPYDRASPSHEMMGRRMAVLAWTAAEGATPRLLVTSPEASIQRLPPRDAATHARQTLKPGETLDRDALGAWAVRVGYAARERVSEPGEWLMLGEVVDIFPPSLPQPVRLRMDADDCVVELDHFDPLTQRTTGTLETVELGAASELVGDDLPRDAGDEHRLPLAYETLESVFGLLPDARIYAEPGAADRARALLEQVEDARHAQLEFEEPGAPAPLSATSLYLSADELASGLSGTALKVGTSRLAPSPRFAGADNPGRAFSDAVREATEGGRTVVLTGLPHELRTLDRALGRGLKRKATRLGAWSEAREAGGVYALEADLAAGFVDEAAGALVLSVADVVGGRIARAGEAHESLLTEPELHVGDVVIHEHHGVGVLRALERVEVDGATTDALRIEYHGGAALLAPMDEIGCIWRYGAEEDAVTLDRLKGDGWSKRRAQVSRQIEADAQALVEQARAREQAKAEPVVPPAAAMARFAARFAFPETRDQKAAIAAVVEDLASGKPMNRLVCGDVGFGKTEVALRAASAVALAGRQVALAAPTTVLARQHAEAFTRRFAGTGVKVAQLSRLVDDAEAKAVKAGLATGEIGVVVGTHGLASESVTFKDLALVIMDEEQKFGAKAKTALAGKGQHLLAMTATPIPRTLQAAMVGVQDVSVIASPPARRRPVRTFLSPFDPATLRTALMREKRRGGQSFVVAPRISDLDGLADRLAEVAPELKVRTAHGELPAEEVDTVMVDFAAGRGDVLLATNIIESGLDVPRANTMLIWRADRFGLAQLHQLRGRVGRGRVQGVAYLLTAPEEELADGTRTRLETLAAFDRLGAGLAIAAHDLDQRGGGDLVGEAQAGHMKLIGAQLYHRLMTRAVRAARGEVHGPDRPPELHLAMEATLAEAYIPDAVVRINLYARLSRLDTLDEVDAFEEELADRFGDPPPAALNLLTRARLFRVACEAGVRKVSSGPKALAIDFHADVDLAAVRRRLGERPGSAWRNDRLLITSEPAEQRCAATLELLGEL